VPKRAKCGVEKRKVLVGRMLRRWVAVCSASAQYAGGMLAWNRRERIILLVERMMRSALPFWADV
jgi:hypothetical protein